MLKSLNLAQAFMKRTIRPVYAHHSAVPYACFLDLDAVPSSTVVYPGMVASKTTGEQMRVCNATTVPFGLFGNFINGTMDELQGKTEIGVWTGGSDAVFEVLAGPGADGDPEEGPLDKSVNWASLNSTAGGVLLYSNADGRLTNVDGGGHAVARLIEAVSATKIKIQLVGMSVVGE
jgi:hypothetical protein